MAGLQATLDLLPTLGLRLCDGFGGKARAPVGLFAKQALTSMFELLGPLGHGEPLTSLTLDEHGLLSVEQAKRWITACEVRCPAPASE
jgi:hypothetical protein